MGTNEKSKSMLTFQNYGDPARRDGSDHALTPPRLVRVVPGDSGSNVKVSPEGADLFSGGQRPGRWPGLLGHPLGLNACTPGRQYHGACGSTVVGSFGGS